MKEINKKAVISGYFGFDNMGDEAILYSMLQLFKEAGKDIKPVVLSNNPKFTSQMYGVEAVNRWNIIEIVGTISRSRLLISGGGSLLQDVTGLKSFLYYLGIIIIAKMLRKKIVLYAQGIGPIRTGPGKLLLKLVLNRVDLITVRDGASKKLLDDFGVKKPPIRVTADPVLGMDGTKISLDKGMHLLKKCGLHGDRPVIGISLRDWKGVYRYKREVAVVADDLIKKGFQVIFLPFHYPEDIFCSRDVVGLMEEGAFIMEEKVTVEEMLSLIGNLHMLLGMRLHSLIMAAVMFVPMVGISYDPKVDSFLKIIGQPCTGRVETISAENLKQHVEIVLENISYNRRLLREITAELRGKVKKNCEDILSILN